MNAISCIAGLAFATVAVSEIDCTKDRALCVAYVQLEKALSTLPDINKERLPAPEKNSQGDLVIYDFKDVAQNIWIVVVVHPNGYAEVSATRIR